MLRRRMSKAPASCATRSFAATKPDKRNRSEPSEEERSKNQNETSSEHDTTRLLLTPIVNGNWRKQEGTLSEIPDSY